MKIESIAVVLSIEMTEEIHEGVPVIKITFFENGLDVNMLHFDLLSTALNSVKQFYAPKWR